MLVFARSLSLSRAVVRAALLASILASPALAGDEAAPVKPATPAPATPATTATTDTSAKSKPVVKETLAFTAQLVDGKKTWVPTKVTAKPGQAYAIVLVNKLAEPHGFKVDNLVQPLIVEANKTQTIDVVMPKEKKSLPFSCQLHPAHVGGEIVVQ
jgi:pyruvate/2-oxoglutarate dehydrogenase complex dihydrolipoamide acyltransferase (E2) component